MSAGGDVTITLPINRASFQAQASDTDGASVSYRWTKESGPSATLNNATSSKLDLQNAQTGTYVLSVTASANGKSASDEVRLVVKSANDPDPEPTPTPAPAPTPSPTPPTSSNSGLRYKYYEGSWPYIPNFSAQKVLKQGTVSNYTLGVRQKDDRYGIVFTGSIQINTSGNYTFYTTSDDGSNLYIDGKKVVDNDGNHGPQERGGSVSLSKGRHAIEVHFIERTVGEMLEVRYAGPGVSKQKIPNGVLFTDGSVSPSDPNPEPAPKPKPKPEPAPKPEPTPPTTSENGLRYRYYEGSWPYIPNFSAQKVLKQGTVSNYTLGVRQKDDRYGIVFTGSIQINTSGNYTFYTTSDDGSNLYIDGKKVVDNDGNHGPQERGGSVSLSKGRHAIEVHFIERTVGEMLEVRYAGPGVSKQKIPDGVLFVDSPNNARDASSTTKNLTLALETNGDLDMTQINVYPIPFDNRLNIDFGGESSNQAIQVSLMDHLGRVILERSVSNDQNQTLMLELSTLGLSKGMYHVRVATEGQLPRSFKVVKR